MRKSHSNKIHILNGKWSTGNEIADTFSTYCGLEDGDFSDETLDDFENRFIFPPIDIMENICHNCMKKYKSEERFIEKQVKTYKRGSI